MRSALTWRFMPVCLALISLGCQSEVIDLSVAADPIDSVSYAVDVQPIFTASCGGGACHINRAANGVNLTTYETVMASRGTRYGSLIVQPGDPAGSPLVDKILPDPRFGVRMPSGRAPLRATEIEIIRFWIQDGAVDN